MYAKCALSRRLSHARAHPLVETSGYLRRYEKGALHSLYFRISYEPGMFKCDLNAVTPVPSLLPPSNPAETHLAGSVWPWQGAEAGPQQAGDTACSHSYWRLAMTRSHNCPERGFPWERHREQGKE